MNEVARAECQVANDGGIDHEIRRVVVQVGAVAQDESPPIQRHQISAAGFEDDCRSGCRLAFHPGVNARLTLVAHIYAFGTVRAGTRGPRIDNGLPL